MGRSIMNKYIVSPVISVLLVGCSSTPKNPDPHENFNRDALCFNLTLDQKVLKPIVTGYENITIEPFQRSVSSFLFNLKEPFRLVNYTLQGDADHAVISIFRFLINSTVGFLGLFDIASDLGLQKRETSYQETLKKWNMPTGDFLMLPVLSSSSTRDVIAEPISWFADPIGYIVGWPWMLAATVARAVDDRRVNGRSRDDMLKNFTDPYPLMRDVYLRTYGEAPTVEEEDDDEEE